MSDNHDWRRVTLAAAAAFLLGAVACAIGAVVDLDGFFRAWLCAYIFWLGVPLAGIGLVFAHDLGGGEWMATARPVLGAAIATMPAVSLAGIPAFLGLHSIYSWTHAGMGLTNTFYLNETGFFIRYAAYVILWNGLAAFALWGPRRGGMSIPPALSWLSGIGLIALILSASFAAIDWMLSIEPTFWSSVFPYIAVASWCNTGLAAVLLTIAVVDWPNEERRVHMVDLARILFATTIFWAYVEFMQFLIIWEENLRSEIPWYLKRLTPEWQPALFVSVGLGFFLPFFVLLWAPSKRSRAVVAVVCVSILLSRVADKWWLVLPEFKASGPFWLDIGAMLALGGLMMLLFGWALRSARRLAPRLAPTWTADHG